ncbi:MAG: Salicylate hydroxylase, partial [Marmoricola sp.]|nr:Salicylate hydroxylase [Marmoricola sp.]
MSGPDIRYELSEEHLRLGRRVHAARPVRLDLGQPGGFDLTPCADRVRLGRAHFGGTWELPVLGEVAAPAALLIGPDGHVAWVGEGTDARLEDALTRWF